MQEPFENKRERIERLLEAAQRIADPKTPLGQRARELLPASTGLSPAGVELALSEFLETSATEAELRSLCESAGSAPRSHVLLSANVFVAALRALALAFAASPKVHVRASRREPVMAELLHEATRGMFRLEEELAPSPGDHVWAYGSDATLSALHAELPAGVTLHPHGSGMGLSIIEQAATVKVEPLVDRLAKDVVAFDQRGCLSPRAALVFGDADFAESIAKELSYALSRWERHVPRGELAPEEAADLAVYRDAMAYAAQLFPAGKGFVGLDSEVNRLLIPPVGRNLHICRVDSLESTIAGLKGLITCVALEGEASLPALAEVLPDARIAKIGMAQCPPLDGPVDRRERSAPEVL